MSSSPVPSRYLQPTKSLENKLDSSREPAAECTFAPQINPLNKKYSNTSLLYLSTNAFERLSRAKSPPTNYNNNNNNNTSISAAAASHDDSSSILLNSPNLNTSSMSQISFQAFLERQQSREQTKQEKLQQIQHALESAHKPKINTKSKELLASKQFSFLERMHNYQQRQEAQHDKKQHMRNKDGKECTFQPKINKASQKLKPKTAEQRQVEYQVKQDRLERARQEKEKKELQQATFKPKLNVPQKNSNNSNNNSYLRLQSEPETYVQRVQAIQKQKQERAQSFKQQQEQKEFEQCTFQPVTHDAPEYVKRIAKSMALAKSMMQSDTSLLQDEQASKPTWR